MNTIHKGFALLLFALLIAVLIPIPYFAWHMEKPLPQPEFKGLTYYQYFAWRRMATEDSIAKYMASHPDYEYSGIGTPMTACYSAHVFGAYLLLPPQSFSYTLAALAGKTPDELHPLPTDVTIENFMPRWWDTFEYLLWYNQIHLDSFGSLVVMCRIQPNIPTPKEFEALKLEHQTNALN